MVAGAIAVVSSLDAPPIEFKSKKPDTRLSFLSSTPLSITSFFRLTAVVLPLRSVSSSVKEKATSRVLATGEYKCKLSLCRACVPTRLPKRPFYARSSTFSKLNQFLSSTANTLTGSCIFASYAISFTATSPFDQRSGEGNDPSQFCQFLCTESQSNLLVLSGLVRQVGIKNQVVVRV